MLIIVIWIAHFKFSAKDFRDEIFVDNLSKYHGQKDKKYQKDMIKNIHSQKMYKSEYGVKFMLCIIQLNQNMDEIHVLDGYLSIFYPSSLYFIINLLRRREREDKGYEIENNQFEDE